MSNEPGPSQNPYGQPAPSGQGDPYGQSYGQSYGQPAGQSYGYGQQPYGATPPRGDKRPGTVTAAAWIAIVFSGLTAALFAFAGLGLLVARDEVITEMERVPEFQDANIDADAAVGVLVVVLLGIVVWCLIAAVLAIFVLRRSNVARILLVISAAVAGVLALISITSGISLVPLVACLATIVLLFVGGAGDWFKRVPASAGGYPGDPAGYQAGQYGYGSPDPYQQPQQQAGTDYPNPYGNPYGTSQDQPAQPGGSPNPYGQVPPTHQDPDANDDGDHPSRDYPGR
ncbi:hypothetical protein Q9S36_43470 [Microbacterium sp. ARD31]|uniref:hypothetical protein n=1 Tax=Microbacterium sp. ARD31 TaxID=2962576 RepID=UPI002881029F|nr:hypothetical protein [Microbacterium sp. ARD31]MDT0187067.1 hypothetical protein [Microbacterium sp. ARD31]